jgi:hypothetical protein
MKNLAFILIIIWFILGASSANDQGYFDSGHHRSCSYVGSALLTVVAGPLNYAGLHPTAAC